MQALYLDIEDVTGVSLHAVRLLDKLRKLLLLGFLYFHEAAEHALIIGVLLQLLEPVEVGRPAFVTQQFSDERGKLAVAESQPAALRDTVGLVLEALRIQLVPLLEHSRAEKVGVDSRNAVDIRRTKHRDIRHVNGAVLYQAHNSALFLGNSAAVHFGFERLAEHDNYIVHLGEYFLDEAAVPLLKSLLHDGVVGVIEHALRRAESLVEAPALVAHYNADKLR